MLPEIVYIITDFLDDPACAALRTTNRWYHQVLSSEMFWRHRFIVRNGPLSHTPCSWRYYYQEGQRVVHRMLGDIVPLPGLKPLYISGQVLVDVYHQPHLFNSMIPFPGQNDFQETVYHFDINNLSHIVYLTRGHELRLVAVKEKRDILLAQNITHATCFRDYRPMFLLQRGEQLSYCSLDLVDLMKGEWKETILRLKFCRGWVFSCQKSIKQFSLKQKRSRFDSDGADHILSIRTSDNLLYEGTLSVQRVINLRPVGPCYYLTNVNNYHCWMKRKDRLIIENGTSVERETYNNMTTMDRAGQTVFSNESKRCFDIYYFIDSYCCRDRCFLIHPVMVKN